MHWNKWKATYIALILLIFSNMEANATWSFCAVTRHTDDGFVALRAGPGTRYSILAKILPSDQLLIGATEICLELDGEKLCDDTGKWKIVESVYSIVPRENRALKGWISERLVRQIGCDDQ